MKCIFCGDTNEKFNLEHVFPESIGGAIVIKEVCAKCNSILSKTVDNPFVRLPNIVAYRHHYSINRNQRDIPDPFSKQRFPDSNGNLYHIVKSGNWYEARYSKQIREVETVRGRAIQLTISKEFIKDLDQEEFIQTQIKQIEAEFGVIVGEYEKSDGTAALVAPILKFKDNIVLLGCLKIAYELASVSLPGYTMDAQAPLYAKMLLEGKLNPNAKVLLTPGKILANVVAKRLLQFSDLAEFDCYCVLQNIEGFGLVATIKVFNLFHSLVLSRQMNYLDERQLIFLNDSRNKCYACSMYKRPLSFSLNFGPTSLSLEQVTLLEKKTVKFQGGDGSIALYDLNGIRGGQLENLWPLTFYNHDWTTLANKKQHKFEMDGTLFLKDEVSGLLFPPQRITFLF